MAKPVNSNPFLGTVIGNTLSSLGSTVRTLIQALVRELAEHALRINGAYLKDGTEPIASYAKADLPTASPAARFLYVTDETGGATIAFSDGTNWRRVQDRAVVS